MSKALKRGGSVALSVFLVCQLFAASDANAASPSNDKIDATLPTVHIDRNPMLAVRSFAALQEQIVRGNREAVSMQPKLAADIAKHLEQFDPSVWDDARNREALIKFVLSGGDPATLWKVFKRGALKELEQALIKASLAYANGELQVAASLFAKFDPRTLAPSLGGHVALIKAILAKQTEPKQALEWCREARLLSPGTLVEESALRLSIELHIANGDRRQFDVTMMQYIRRFPDTAYNVTIDMRIARVLATDSRTLDGRHPIALVEAYLPAERRSALFSEIAVAALRGGNLATATAAARRLQQLAPDGTLAASARVIAAAGMIFGKERAAALQLLKEAETLGIGAAMQQLIGEIRSLASMIEAPPEALDKAARTALFEKPQNTPSARNPQTASDDALIMRVKTTLNEIDRLLSEEKP